MCVQRGKCSRLFPGLTKSIVHLNNTRKKESCRVNKLWHPFHFITSNIEVVVLFIIRLNANQITGWGWDHCIPCECNFYSLLFMLGRVTKEARNREGENEWMRNGEESEEREKEKWWGKKVLQLLNWVLLATFWFANWESLNCKSRDQWTENRHLFFYHFTCSTTCSWNTQRVTSFLVCMFCGLFKRTILLFVSHNNNHWMTWREGFENRWMESRKEEMESEK